MGPLGLGPVAIAFMWNVTGRAAGSVFIGEKSSKEAPPGSTTRSQGIGENQH